MNYFLALLFVLNLSPEKNDLGLKLELGKTYSQTYVSRIDIAQTINGIEQEQKMEIKGGMDFRVIQSLEDRYIMSTSYTSLIMKMNSFMGETTFSSENNEENLLSKILKDMKGKEFTVEMYKNGVIRQIKDIENLYSGIFESFPEVPQLQKQQIFSQLESAYGEKAFKGNIEMITAIFPDSKVKVGEHWNNSVKLESGMSGLINNTFTLSKFDKENVIVEGVSKIVTEDKEAYVDVNGMPVKYNLSGTMKSTFKLDPISNWILEGTVEQEISGNVEIKDNPNIPGGMVIPMIMIHNMIIGQ